nr:E-beta-farnesene synthase [Tanacetum cinerariifolium]
MADMNINAPTAMAPPVRTDDQILPRIRWVPIGKSKCYLALEKSQSNPIYKIAFWDTVQYDKKAGCYMCQLDEHWFVLTKDTLREALQIKPVNNNQAFIAPLSSDALINIVNELGYPKFVRNLSNVRRHKFHPRPDSPLHLPNEEPVLGYLKFSAKGTKREVFGMPIPDNLITTDIQEASYYQEYLAKVAQHRRYLAGETWSDPDSPVPKPTKPARKPKQKRSLKNVAESVAEDEPAKEPQGPLLPVVIKEPESGKYQPLLEVPGKGKAKVTEEQVAHDLLSLQKPKKKSPANQYIFQRLAFEPTGSSGHNESPYVVLGQSDSEEESEKVVLGADEGGQDEGQAGPDPGGQAEGQTGSDVGAQDEGQAGSNLDENSKGQAGLDPGNAGAEVQSISSPVVYAGSDCEHMDLDAADVSLQPSMEQLDEGFTATAYPKVQENLRLTVEEHVLLEDPASSSRTLSSLQNLSKDISFGDLFFSDKPSDVDNDQANAETEVESMRPESPKVRQQFKATATETTTTTTTTTTTLPPLPAQQQSIAEAMMMKLIVELEHIMANLIQENKGLKERLDSHGAHWAMQVPLGNRFRDLPEADMKEILHQRMWETESYKSHEDHMQLYEALEKSMNRDHSEELAQDLAEARKKKKKSRESPKTPHGSPPHQPPPPPPPAGPSGASGAPGASRSSQVPPPPPLPSSTNPESQSKGSDAPSSSKTATSAEYQAWTTTDIRLRPSISLTPADLEMDKDMGPDEQAQSSDDEDIRSAHIPKVNLRQDWWKPFEKERPATPEPAWSIQSSDVPVPTNNWASALASNYSPPPKDSLLAVEDPILRRNVSKPLPLGGPPGQVTIQSDFFFSKDLEYLRYGSKGRRPALSISKMKAAYYLDVGLEQMVPDQQRFYIDRHTSEGDRSAIRTHMRILSVVRIEVFSMYGYDYMKKIVLRRMDLNEHVIAERDFKYLYPSDFEDLVQMMMRFNDIHKFSDGTLQQIDEALDYKVKEFRINRMNPGLNTRFWTRKDVDRSKAFMFAIQKRLKKRRIFRNLESFVGGRVREGDYRLLKRTE